MTNQGKRFFTSETPWPVEWHSLRTPVTRLWCRRSEKGLLLRGRNSIYSLHDCSLVARRIQHFNCKMETLLDYPKPKHRQMAGMILLTGNHTFYYLRKYYSESLKSSCLAIYQSLNGEPREHLDYRNPLDKEKPLHLAAEINREELQFFWAYEGEPLQKIGPVLDASLLSDEFTNNGPGAFDGTFCGLTTLDLNQQNSWANFRYFSYEEIKISNS